MDPYIGISGFADAGAVRNLLSRLHDNPGRQIVSRRLVAIGVMHSSSTCMGHENSHPRRYPKKEDIAGIFPSSELTLNVLHYNSEERNKALADSLRGLVELGGPNLQAIQLNTPEWPTPNAINTFKVHHPGLQLILQISTQALRAINNDPDELVLKMRDDYPNVDRVLLDASSGTGKEANVEQILSYLVALQNSGLKIGLGMAGGIGPTNMDQILPPLLEVEPRLSWDAESNLLTDNDDPNLVAQEAYLERGFQLTTFARVD